MALHVVEEEKYRFHAADVELLEGALELVGGHLVREGAARDLDQQRVVVGADLGAREARAGIEADAHALSRAEHLQAASVRLQTVTDGRPGLETVG